MSNPSEPPNGTARIPVWLISIFVTCLLAAIGGGLAIATQIGAASAEIHGAVERIAGIEARLNQLANIEAHQAVIDAQLAAERQRLDRLEQRDDRVAASASLPR